MFYFIDPVRGWTGYSKAARGLALAMSKKTFVRCLDFNPTGYLPEAIYHLMLGYMPELRSQDFIFGRVYFSDLLKWKQNGDNSLKLIANLALECDRFPERLVRDCNDDRIEQIWVPSTFVKDNLVMNNVIEDKIKVIPHGYDPEIYKVKRVPREDYFRFFFNGGYTGPGDRKGADLLVKAFREEFNEELKGLGKRGVDYSKIPMLYLKINTSYGNASKELETSGVVIDTNFYSEKELAELYNKADCYVCPSAGEAFDMGTLEAMACGLPVIHNSKGGQFDYLKDNERVSLLPSDRTTAKFSPWDIGNWWKIDKDILKYELRKVYEERPKVKKYKNIKNWVWSEAARKAMECLK